MDTNKNNQFEINSNDGTKGITLQTYFVGLVSLSILCFVMMNIFALRPVGIKDGLRITEAGLIFVSIVMVIQNMIGEVWGQKTAIKVSIFAIICQICIVILARLAILLPIPEGEDNVFLAETFRVMFDGHWRIVVGSIMAFVAASAFNIFVYAKIRTMFRNRKGGLRLAFAIAAIGSTIISQVADDMVYNIIAFAPTGGLLDPVYELGWDVIFVQVVTGIVSQILVEAIIVALIAVHFVKIIKAKAVMQGQSTFVDDKGFIH